MVNAQASISFHGLGEELWPAVGKGRVDLIHAEAGYFYVAIARNRDQLGLAGARDMQEHDGIGASLAHIATGIERLLIFFRQALAGIGSHQQPIGAGSIGYLLIRKGIHAVQPRIGP